MQNINHIQISPSNLNRLDDDVSRDTATARIGGASRVGTSPGRSQLLRSLLLGFGCLGFVGFEGACADSSYGELQAAAYDGESSGLLDAGDSGESADAGGSQGDDEPGVEEAGNSESGADDGQAEPPLRITAAWAEPEGVYVRAVPGDGLMQAVPETAEVVAFFPSQDNEPSVYFSLIDADGETLFAMRSTPFETDAAGAAFDSAVHVQFFSKWGNDLPIGYCVTEPCPFSPWPDASWMTLSRLDQVISIDGEIDQSSFNGSYDMQDGTLVTLEQAGYEQLNVAQAQALQVAGLAAADGEALLDELVELPDVDTTGLPGPCETATGIAAGAAGALAAACCAETGLLACTACMTAAYEVVEGLEGLC